MFDSLERAQDESLLFWRYNSTRQAPHSSLGNQNAGRAGRTLEPFEGAVPARCPNRTKEYGKPDPADSVMNETIGEQVAHNKFRITPPKLAKVVLVEYQLGWCFC